jgi:type II secretory pathway predicted ATPase ExeA
MSSPLSFPTPRKKVRILTGMMKYASKLTLEAHYNGGLVMWSGGVGRGKTWCAEWMVEELNAQYDSLNPDTFRLKHYEIGRIHKWSGREEKIALRSLYHATIGPMDEGVYRAFPLEAIAETIVHGLRRVGYQIIFVDEAGRLSLNALDGLVLISDTAGIMKWPLTIVLIGMDDLPIKIKLNERINSRIHQKVCFEPYKLDETWDLLAALDQYFADLNRNKSKDKEQVALVHELTGGNPRAITSFVGRFIGMRQGHPNIDPMVVIRSAHVQPSREEMRMREDMGFSHKKKSKKKGSKRGRGEGAKDNDEKEAEDEKK